MSAPATPADQPIRLTRESPTAQQAGCAIAIGVALTLLGAVIFFLMRSPTPRPGENDWLVPFIGGAFALVGVLMLFFGLKMLLMSRLPETIVELDRVPLRAGQAFRVVVRQPGPIRLKSLRLNLVAEQLTRREVWRKNQRRIETDRRLVHQQNVVDVQEITVLRGEQLTREGQATVPPHVELVDIEGRKTVVWRLEVWGRVRGWVDFGHPFEVAVVGVDHGPVNVDWSDLDPDQLPPLPGPV